MRYSFSSPLANTIREVTTHGIAPLAQMIACRPKVYSEFARWNEQVQKVQAEVVERLTGMGGRVETGDGGFFVSFSLAGISSGPRASLHQALLKWREAADRHLKRHHPKGARR